jgi:hypothetical protein
LTFLLLVVRRDGCMYTSYSADNKEKKHISSAAGAATWRALEATLWVDARHVPPRHLKSVVSQAGHAHMDCCPIEIWSIIFTFACTDGGVTGRSLSLTSRHVRELSKVVKLQSLMVTEAQQILGLARLLADTPPKYRRVRHLFIGDAVSKWCDEGELVDILDHQWQERLEEIHRSEEPILDAYLYIITATAPTLMTLVVHFLAYLTYLTYTSFPDGASFPSLIELSLYGHRIHNDEASAPMPGRDNTSSSGRPPSFPSLRRLYLAHGWYDPATYIRRITRVAPLLTHLYLPYQYPMKNHLRQLLGIRPAQSRDDNSSSSSSNVVHPLALKVLLIDRYYNLSRSAPQQTRMLYKIDEEGVEAIAEKDERVYLIKQRRSNRFKDAETYWLDRMEGGDGIWVVPQPSELPEPWSEESQ